MLTSCSSGSGVDANPIEKNILFYALQILNLGIELHFVFDRGERLILTEGNYIQATIRLLSSSETPLQISDSLGTKLLLKQRAKCGEDGNGRSC